MQAEILVSSTSVQCAACWDSEWGSETQTLRQRKYTFTMSKFGLFLRTTDTDTNTAVALLLIFHFISSCMQIILTMHIPYV